MTESKEVALEVDFGVIISDNLFMGFVCIQLILNTLVVSQTIPFLLSKSLKNQRNTTKFPKVQNSVKFSTE